MKGCFYQNGFCTAFNFKCDKENGDCDNCKRWLDYFDYCNSCSEEKAKYDDEEEKIKELRMFIYKNMEVFDLNVQNVACFIMKNKDKLIELLKNN